MTAEARIKQVAKKLDQLKAASEPHKIEVVFYDTDTMTEAELEQQRRECEARGETFIIVSYDQGTKYA